MLLGNTFVDIQPAWPGELRVWTAHPDVDAEFGDAFVDETHTSFWCLSQMRKQVLSQENQQEHKARIEMLEFQTLRRKTCRLVET